MKNADPTFLRQLPLRSAINSRGPVLPSDGGLKLCDVAALGIQSGHDVLNGAVFAGCVHLLEQSQAVRGCLWRIELCLGARLTPVIPSAKKSARILFSKIFRLIGRIVVLAERYFLAWWNENSLEEFLLFGFLHRVNSSARLCSFERQYDQRINAAPALNPAPTDASNTREPSFNRPSDSAESNANGSVPAVVLPYSSILITTLSRDSPIRSARIGDDSKIRLVWNKQIYIRPGQSIAF